VQAERRPGVAEDDEDDEDDEGLKEETRQLSGAPMERQEKDWPAAVFRVGASSGG
jgi:hypothetical protein